MRRRSVVVLATVAALLAGTVTAGAGIEETLKEPLTEARHQAHEVVERNVKVDLVEKLGAAMPFEGVTTLSTEPKTLYFHAQTPVSTVDEINEFTASGPGPFMDPNPPTDVHPTVALNTGAGNLNFRKNFLNAYWGGKVRGVIHGNPTVKFWFTGAALKAEVAIFGDGGIGAASPAATRTVDVVGPVPTEVSVAFPGLELPVGDEVVVQISGRLEPASNNQTAGILFDSTLFPSAFDFTLSPLVIGLPKLDDPIGIIHRATHLVLANAGTGDLLETTVTGTATATLRSGVVPGGFARGLTGLASDASGRIYGAVADTGEILMEPGGVYARGLGAPVGIAFDAAGNLYVADAAGRRVLRVSPSGARTIVTSGFPAAPYGLAFAPDGSLAVSTQRDARVYSVDVASGDTHVIASLGAGHSAEGLAYAAGGNLYIGDGRAGRVFRLGPTGLTELAKDLGGPIMLAFEPAATNLVIATQGEGRAGGDAILTVDAGETGLAPHTPALAPTSLAAAPQSWVYRAGARALDPDSVGAALVSAESRYTGNNGFEPTMGVQTDGDVFTVGGDFDQAGGVLGSPKVYRSRNHGRTWADVTPKSLVQPEQDAPPITLDPYIYVDETTNRVFNPELITACIYLNYSDDDGDTWITNPLGCGGPPVDHQTVVTGKPRVSVTDGYPNVVYHCSNWVTHSPCGRSLDGGKTWLPAGIAQAGGVADIYRAPDSRSPTDTGVNCSSLTGHLATDPEGRVYLPRATCGRPIISASEDDGLTWQTHLVDPANAVGANNHEAIVAADAAGTLYYIWIGRDRLPYLAVSTDHARTWSTPKMVAPPGVTEANLPSVAAGAAGSIAMLYMATTTDYGYTARNYGKAAWSTYITVATGAGGPDPVFQSATVAPLTDPLMRANCGPGRCGNVFDFLDVVIDSSGRAWGTFVDACTGPCVASRGGAATDGKAGVAPLQTGPNLRGGGVLTPLP